MSSNKCFNNTGPTVQLRKFKHSKTETALAVHGVGDLKLKKATVMVYCL
jgi:hypothetical protein